MFKQGDSSIRQKIDLRDLRDQRIFTWQSIIEVLNLFNILTLEQVFWKMKTYFKKSKYSFSVQSTTIESAAFPCTMPCCQIEWGVYKIEQWREGWSKFC